MTDLLIHLGLFSIAALVIVTLGAFYAEPDDAKALRSLPRRFFTFMLGCGLLAAVMLICEHTFASVG